MTASGAVKSFANNERKRTVEQDVALASAQLATDQKEILLVKLSCVLEL